MRQICRKEKQNPFSPVVKVAEELNNLKEKTVNRAGMFGRFLRKKPMISEVNKQKRLQYATCNESLWNDVLFTDESKFEIYKDRKSPKVWKSKNSAL